MKVAFIPSANMSHYLSIGVDVLPAVCNDLNATHAEYHHAGSCNCTFEKASSVHHVVMEAINDIELDELDTLISRTTTYRPIWVICDEVEEEKARKPLSSLLYGDNMGVLDL